MRDEMFKSLEMKSVNLYTDRLLLADHVQEQTSESFSFKWEKLKSNSDQYKSLDDFQRNWFLRLYGFDSEGDLSRYLSSVTSVLDAGTGKGYKAAWIARLAPHANVIGVDISSAVFEAAEHYSSLANLTFVQSDISRLDFCPDNYFDFSFCDQVIMHTPEPRKTFSTLVGKTAPGGTILVYVYRKKALPRELVDTYFRTQTHSISNDDMLKMSEQLTALGRFLEDNVKGEFDFPGVELLGIKPGKMSVQRFLYWNFLKCFWNKDFGHDLSVLTNFDWYSPSQAERYSKEEFLSWIQEENLETLYFNEEEACFSARLRKAK